MVTTKLRAQVFEKLQVCGDRLIGPALSLKNLEYGLRIGLASNMYHKRDDETEEETTRSRLAKHNLSRLLKDIDFYHALPPDEAGILRNSYPFSLMPFNPISAVEKATLKSEVKFVTNTVARRVPNFVIFSSKWGINDAVSLPIVSVITPTSDSELEINLKEYYGPYNYDTFPIRFGKGHVEPTGRVWYYPRTPVSSSLSDDTDPPGAGTLGFYVVDNNDPTSRYIVTAGHIVPEHPALTNSTLYAPAKKPFEEAKHSLQIALSGSLTCGDTSERALHQTRLDTLVNLDRKIGDVVYTTTQTSKSVPYYKEDVALVKVRPERAADNSLERIPLYSLNVQFKPGEVYIPAEIAPLNIGTPVVKVGIRTGYTEGVIVSNANLRWKAESTHTVCEKDPEYNSLPTSSAYAIQGDNGQLFSDSGDSGSLVVTLQKDEVVIEKCLAVGMVYGMLLEDPPMPSLTFFYPMKDLMDKLRRETGLDLCMDAREFANSNDPWPYMEHGSGRSVFDLK